MLVLLSPQRPERPGCIELSPRDAQTFDMPAARPLATHSASAAELSLTRIMVVARAFSAVLSSRPRCSARMSSPTSRSTLTALAISWEPIGSWTYACPERASTTPRPNATSCPRSISSNTRPRSAAPGKGLPEGGRAGCGGAGDGSSDEQPATSGPAASRTAPADSNRTASRRRSSVTSVQRKGAGGCRPDGAPTHDRS